MKISVVVVESTKGEEDTADDTFQPTEVSGVVLGVPEDESVVEMSLEKDSAALVDKNSTVETSRVEFENVEDIAVDVFIVLSIVKFGVEFCIELCQ